MSDLGTFLKDRRARLDPVTFGFGAARRRTPGLRREEVAQRANVSATWYTWLEQGRGGAPSADVLDRVARALVLNEAEREHLFLLARPPQVRPAARGEVSPHLQRVLDALEYSPALVKNVMWDIVAWNRAAVAVLVDYAQLPPERRNILKLFFGIAHGKTAHWENNARLMVAAFRLETARMGVSDQAKALVDEMIATSPEFARLWSDNEVHAFGEGTKHIAHPSIGEIALDYSGFAVDGRPDLTMFVYTPATDGDLAKVRALVAARSC